MGDSNAWYKMTFLKVSTLRHLSSSSSSFLHLRTQRKNSLFIPITHKVPCFPKFAKKNYAILFGRLWASYQTRPQYQALQYWNVYYTPSVYCALLHASSITISDCEPSSSFFSFRRFLCLIDELRWALKLATRLVRYFHNK